MAAAPRTCGSLLLEAADEQFLAAAGVLLDEDLKLALRTAARARAILPKPAIDG